MEKPLDWSELSLDDFRREEERLARLEAAKAYVEADWIRESEAAADDCTSEDEAAHLEQFECVACDKIFKSEKALTNHTRSVVPAMRNVTSPWNTSSRLGVLRSRTRSFFKSECLHPVHFNSMQVLSGMP